MEIKRFRNQSHWGAFWAEVLNGRVVGVKPFELDQNPSPLIASIPGATHADNRVPSPMVRAGWLEKGPSGTGEGRGREPFVRVSWEKAYDLVSTELLRVKRNMEISQFSVALTAGLALAFFIVPAPKPGAFYFRLVGARISQQIIVSGLQPSLCPMFWVTSNQ